MRMRTLIIGAVCFWAQIVSGVQQSVPFIHADEVHANGITGLGVTVAVIDSGVFYDHPGLLGGVAPGGDSVIDQSFVGDDGEDVWDDGHGTHVSLIITDQNGVAHDAKILPIRVFEWRETPSGWRYGAKTMDIVLAIRYAIALKALDPSIQVINLSLEGTKYACPCDLYDPDRADAIADAEFAGIVTFAATGNTSTCGEIGTPACDSAAVKVAASYDKRYPTQDHGQCTDFLPPAYWITCFSNVADCNYLLAAPGFDISVGGMTMSGTSQATPHCSGVAALMLDRAGRCSGAASLVKTYMYNTATQVWWAYPFCQSVPIEPRHVNALAAVSAIPASSCASTIGDLNCDDELSAADFASFSLCMTAPDAGGRTGSCTCADFPESPPDGDIDLRDFIHFQQLFSGGGSASSTVALDISSPNNGQTVQPGEVVTWTITAGVSQGDNAGLAAIAVDLFEETSGRPAFPLPAGMVVGTGMEGFARPAGISNPDTGVNVTGYGGTPFWTAEGRGLRQIGGAQNTSGAEGHTGTGTDFTIEPGVGQSGPQIIASGSFVAPRAAGQYVFRIANGLANVLDSVQPAPVPPAMWPVSGANVIVNTATFSITVARPEFVAFDLDRDGDADMNDFATMQICYSGALPVEVGCVEADLTGDGKVDEKDVVLMVQCGSGAGVPADPVCGDCNDDGILDVRESETDLGEDPPDEILVLGRARCNGGITGCDDNCPCVSNPDQIDSDGDGVGDACEPNNGGSAPDSDGDGIADSGDNCPGVANADQANMDGDGAGDVCDIDRDGDGLNNDVDPCPDNGWTYDIDGDGIHDACDPDLDGDEVLEDGDGNGIPGDNPCTGGATTGCDDNCGLDVNPDQLDWDGDGIGNACDPEPGLPPEELGGELMSFGWVDPLSMEALAGEPPVAQDTLTVPTAGAMAYFVTHDGTGRSVDLPAGGGTVVVDVVVATAGPLDVWEVTPTVSAANVVSIDAAGWSSRAELLAWAGLSSEVPATRYNCGEVYWIIANAQGSAVCQAWAGTVCADRLLNAGTRALTGSYDLDALAGPMNTPAGAVFTSASPIGAIASRTIAGGKAVRVATLTLNVAGVPGTYWLTLTNGSWYSAAAGEQAAMSAGPGFEVRVGE